MVIDMRNVKRNSNTFVKIQICIPKEIREQLHIEAGQEFVFILRAMVFFLAPKMKSMT